MPGELPLRILRAFIALWFVMSVGEPAAAHFCPMHGGGLLQHAGGSAMGGMAMPPGAAAGQVNASPSTGVHSASDSPGDRADHHRCTCIECCVGTGAVALPTTRLAFQPAIGDGADAAALPTADVLARPAPPHATPLGTGPPRV